MDLGLIGAFAGNAAETGMKTYERLQELDSKKLADQLRQQQLEQGKLALQTAQMDLEHRQDMDAAGKRIQAATQRRQYGAKTAAVADPMNAGDPTPGIDQSAVGGLSKPGPNYDYVNDPVQFHDYLTEIQPDVMKQLGTEKGLQFMSTVKKMHDDFVPQAMLLFRQGKKDEAISLMRNYSPSYNKLEDIKPIMSADGTTPTGRVQFVFPDHSVVLDQNALLTGIDHPEQLIALDRQSAADARAQETHAAAMRLAPLTEQKTKQETETSKLHGQYWGTMGAAATTRANTAATAGPRVNPVAYAAAATKPAHELDWVKETDPSDPTKQRVNQDRAQQVIAAAVKLAAGNHDFANSPSGAVLAVQEKFRQIDKDAAQAVAIEGQGVKAGEPEVSGIGNSRTQAYYNNKIPGTKNFEEWSKARQEQIAAKERSKVGGVQPAAAPAVAPPAPIPGLNTAAAPAAAPVTPGLGTVLAPPTPQMMSTTQTPQTPEPAPETAPEAAPEPGLVVPPTVSAPAPAPAIAAPAAAATVAPVAPPGLTLPPPEDVNDTTPPLKVAFTPNLQPVAGTPAGARAKAAGLEPLSPLQPPAPPIPAGEPIPQGMIRKGSLNPFDRPVIQNKEGPPSTTKTITIGVDDNFVVIPTIINGKDVGPEKAKEYYRAYGQNFGTFDTQENADAFARNLSKEQGKRLDAKREAEAPKAEAPKAAPKAETPKVETPKPAKAEPAKTSAPAKPQAQAQPTQKGGIVGVGGVPYRYENGYMVPLQ